MRRVGANSSGVVSLASVSRTNVGNLNPGAGTTIISAIQNTNGVIVRSLVIGGDVGGNSMALVAVDGVFVATATMLNNIELWSMPDDLLLSPGQVLSAVAGSATVDAMATWDDLP